MAKALVIDDEVALTMVIARFLEGAGIDAEVATSGPEGLQKAILAQPDVIIVDIMMPEMDGYEVCRRLRKDPRTTRAAIVVLTARSQLIDRDIALRAGADVHMAKPFKGNVLIQEIQQLLAERRPMVRPLGYQILVLRLKQGVGATTLAVNLALCLTKEQKRLTVVADMVLQGGQTEDRLGLPLVKPWQNALGRDAAGLEECLVRHASGLFALPTPPPNADQASPAQVATVLQILREWHDFVVVDTPFNLGPLASVLLESSPLILLLLTPDPVVLRTAQASLAAIKGLDSRASRIWAVLSMASPDQQPPQQAEVLGLPVAAVLPWSPEESAQAVASCVPVVLSYPDSPLAAAFRHLAQQVVEAADEHPLGRSSG